MHVSCYVLCILQREIRRGHQICEMWGSRGNGGLRSTIDFPWEELMAPAGPEFFRQYPRYIQVNGAAYCEKL